jgi:hypothetical protein
MNPQVFCNKEGVVMLIKDSPSMSGHIRISIIRGDVRYLDIPRDMIREMIDTLEDGWLGEKAKEVLADEDDPVEKLQCGGLLIDVPLNGVYYTKGKTVELDAGKYQLIAGSGGDEGDAARYEEGDLVFTYRNAGRDDWVGASRENCQWQSIGMILDVHDAHGLCYEVKHAKGKVAHYDHDELRLVEQLTVHCYSCEGSLYSTPLGPRCAKCDERRVLEDYEPCECGTGFVRDMACRRCDGTARVKKETE